MRIYRDMQKLKKLFKQFCCINFKMVHIGEISFCGKKAFNIRSDDTKKYILDRIERQYGIKIITKHYEKFDPKYVANLNTNPHMLCLRSNGNPYFLYLTKLNFVNYCIFIDKKIQQGYFFPRMIITGYHFDDSLFNDTILDGEMIKMPNEKWMFIINDMLVYQGSHLKDQNFVKRINLCYEMLKKYYKADSMDVSRVQVKKYFRYDELDKLFNEHLPKLQYTCRGIYFKPLFMRFKDVLMNFDDTLVKKVERNKYKNVKNFLLMDDKEDIETNGLHDDANAAGIAKVPSSISVCSASSAEHTPCSGPTPTPQVNTKVFSVRKKNTPDSYDLFDESGTCIGDACIPTLKISKYMRDLFAQKNVVDTISLPFEFFERFNKWKPIIQ